MQLLDDWNHQSKRYMNAAPPAEAALLAASTSRRVEHMNRSDSNHPTSAALFPTRRGG